MRRWQISLAGLLGVLAYCGLCFGAAVSRTPIWSSLVYTLLLLALSLALLGAIFAPRSSRTFWIGFASIGWAYYLLPRFSYATWLNLLPYALAEWLETRLPESSPYIPLNCTVLFLCALAGGGFASALDARRRQEARGAQGQEPPTAQPGGP